MPLPWPTSGSAPHADLPAILTALGVTFLAAGLLSFTTRSPPIPLADALAQPDATAVPRDADAR